MVFKFRISAFLNFPLILHKIKQKNPANYPLQIFCIYHSFCRKILQITHCLFSALHVLQSPPQTTSEVTADQWSGSLMLFVPQTIILLITDHI